MESTCPSHSAPILHSPPLAIRLHFSVPVPRERGGTERIGARCTAGREGRGGTDTALCVVSFLLFSSLFLSLHHFEAQRSKPCWHVSPPTLLWVCGILFLSPSEFPLSRFTRFNFSRYSFFLLGGRLNLFLFAAALVCEGSNCSDLRLASCKNNLFSEQRWNPESLGQVRMTKEPEKKKGTPSKEKEQLSGKEGNCCTRTYTNTQHKRTHARTLTHTALTAGKRSKLVQGKNADQKRRTKKLEVLEETEARGPIPIQLYHIHYYPSCIHYCLFSSSTSSIDSVHTIS